MGVVIFSSQVGAEHTLETMNNYAGPLSKGKPLRLMWKEGDPTMRRSNLGKIFVNGLAPSIDSKTFYDTFAQFGAVLSCKLVTNNRGASRSYGFVHFESPHVAEKTIRTVNRMKMAGKKVIVRPIKSRRDREAHGAVQTKFTNVYGARTEECISDFSEITSVYIARYENRIPKGVRFREFLHRSECAARCC